MPGRGFLAPARDGVSGATEYHWRAAAVHAYYALLLEARDALFRWGFKKPKADSVHAWVRLRFAYAANADLKRIGDVLDRLVRLRNDASYNLIPLKEFASPADAQDAINDAADAISLLDQIEADPARRAAGGEAFQDSVVGGRLTVDGAPEVWDVVRTALAEGGHP